MLDKGIIERIILDYKDILKQAMEDNISSAAELPYFEGDFWPNVLEESIKELDQEEEEKRKQAEAAEAVVSIHYYWSQPVLLSYTFLMLKMLQSKTFAYIN